MAFLAPLFFAGLAAIGIPILVHLIQRERKNAVEFLSLMFIRKIPYHPRNAAASTTGCCCSCGCRR